MRLTADTNILLRSLLNDDPVQSPLAQRALAEAELVAIPLTVFCELVWILRGRFKLPKAEISETILRLTQSANVVTHQPAVEAGLAILDAGGDFADGAIAFEGKWLGGDSFATFDKKAAKLIEAQGGSVALLQP